MRSASDACDASFSGNTVIRVPVVLVTALRHDRPMRRRIAALVVCVALASALGVVGLAATTANGLPSYTNGYSKWSKLNRKPIKGGSPAHSGVKNVYASKRRVGTRFPAGTVVVKTIARPGDKAAMPGQVAVMRKADGRWSFVEYQLSGARYTILAQGQLCVSCHVQAKRTDYVFTR